MGISPFLTQNIVLNPFYTFCTWGNFKQLVNAEHLNSTHPTVHTMYTRYRCMVAFGKGCCQQTFAVNKRSLSTNRLRCPTVQINKIWTGQKVAVDKTQQLPCTVVVKNTFEASSTVYAAVDLLSACLNLAWLWWWYQHWGIWRIFCSTYIWQVVVLVFFWGFCFLSSL